MAIEDFKVRYYDCARMEWVERPVTNVPPDVLAHMPEEVRREVEAGAQALCLSALYA